MERTQGAETLIEEPVKLDTEKHAGGGVTQSAHHAASDHRDRDDALPDLKDFSQKSIVRVALTVAGCALSMSAFFSVFFFSWDAGIEGINLLCFVVAALVTSALAYPLTNYFQRNYFVVAAIALALSCFATIQPFFVSDWSDSWMVVHDVCSGIAFSLLFMMQIGALSESTKVIRFVFAIGLAAAVLVCLTFFVVQASARGIVVTSTIVASSLLTLLYESPLLAPAHQELVEARESDKRCRISRNSLVLVFANTTVLGFGLVMAFHTNNAGPVPSIVAAVCALVLFAAISVDSLRHTILGESTFRKLSLPLITLCLLAAALLPKELKIPAFTVLVVVSLIPFSSTLFATAVHIARDKLSTFRTCSVCLSITFLGMLVGLVLGLLSESDYLGGGQTPAISIALLLVLIVTLTVVFDQKSLYPALAKDGNGLYPEEEEEDEAEHKKTWKEQCYEKAEEAGLTPRETEIMILLAKGYSAELVCQHLGISKNTVRCHTSNIYSKMAVHSKTELMALFELNED